MASRRVRKPAQRSGGGGPVAARSWQARNPAYSYVALAVSIAALLLTAAMMVMH